MEKPRFFGKKLGFYVSAYTEDGIKILRLRKNILHTIFTKRSI